MSTNNSINNDSVSFTETSDAFSVMLSQFIKVKEGYPHNHDYRYYE